MKISDDRRTIALVAHDNKKAGLLEWARFNRHVLARHSLVATGTTADTLQHELGVPVRKLLSGPLGGDQQLGAMISEGGVDFLVFFWDPLEPHPHDMDVKALLRIGVVWNIPIACNRSTADFMISSPLLSSEYRRTLPDYAPYLNREIRLRPSSREPATVEAAPVRGSAENVELVPRERTHR